MFGNAGAAHFAFVAHHPGQEPTAARLRLKVVGAAPSHKVVTAVAQPFLAIEPYAHGLLDVGDGNQIYWETSGNPDGKAALGGARRPRRRGTPWQPQGVRPRGLPDRPVLPARLR